jgi:HSP20 family protein
VVAVRVLFFNTPTWSTTTSQIIPTLSVRADLVGLDKEYKFRADFPGVTKDNVQGNVVNSVLSVTASRETRSEDVQETYHRMERSYGQYERRLRLPANVDQSGSTMTAQFKDGVLTISMPKITESRPSGRQITII